MTTLELARKAGINPRTVRTRLHRGWDLDAALSIPTVLPSQSKAERAERAKEKRLRRLLDGDCVHCGLEPQDGGVLGAACRERNNRRRRRPGNPGWPKGRPRTKKSIPMFHKAAA